MPGILLPKTWVPVTVLRSLRTPETVASDSKIGIPDITIYVVAVDYDGGASGTVSDLGSMPWVRLDGVGSSRMARRRRSRMKPQIFASSVQRIVESSDFRASMDGYVRSAGATITDAVTLYATADADAGSYDSADCLAAVACCFVGAMSSDRVSWLPGFSSLQTPETGFMGLKSAGSGVLHLDLRGSESRYPNPSDNCRVMLSVVKACISKQLGFFGVFGR